LSFFRSHFYVELVKELLPLREECFCVKQKKEKSLKAGKSFKWVPKWPPQGPINQEVQHLEIVSVFRPLSLIVGKFSQPCVKRQSLFCSLW
jgi:hypothetical protein